MVIKKHQNKYLLFDREGRIVMQVHNKNMAKTILFMDNSGSMGNDDPESYIEFMHRRNAELRAAEDRKLYLILINDYVGVNFQYD